MYLLVVDPCFQRHTNGVMANRAPSLIHLASSSLYALYRHVAALYRHVAALYRHVATHQVCTVCSSLALAGDLVKNALPASGHFRPHLSLLRPLLRCQGQSAVAITGTLFGKSGLPAQLDVAGN